MKKKTLLAFIGILVVSIFVLFLATLNNDSTLEAVDSEQLTTLLDEESELQYIYIGKPTCSVCAEFLPILEEVIEEEELDVYYYNTDTAREADEALLSEVMERLGVTGVPAVLAIENGTEVNRIVGRSTKEEIQAFFNR